MIPPSSQRIRLVHLSPPFDVVIVGAGPVGLFLACRLAQLGVSFKVIEKRHSSFQHSRSIGIHPPSLEKLEGLGVVSELLRRGVKISRGHGFINRRHVGTLDFSSCKKPYNFVLSLPQFETEAILEKRLCALASLSLAPSSLGSSSLDSSPLLRGLEVTALRQNQEDVELDVQPYPNAQQGEQLGRKTLRAKFVVACDGKDSKLRECLQIPFQGGDYRDAYVMGDFADTTNFGTDAAIYLTDDGLVESFPLAQGLRRWVARTKAREMQPTVQQLASLVRERLGLELPLQSNTMLSSFGVQHYVARAFVKHRVLLAGDAAHVVSPIGGQGMNLGWLDAWVAAEVLARVVLEQQPLSVLKHYDEQQQRVARNVMRRAAFNMRMGRATRFGGTKYVLAKLLLQQPFAGRLANMFTMRGLEG
ncbi:MAG: FAD-dependent oxidoreductase [Trueperaceae bacterium]